MAILIITSFAKVDTPISFGILFCMAASTLIASLLDRCILLESYALAFAVVGAIFFLPFKESLSESSEFGLEWLGFPSEGFSLVIIIRSSPTPYFLCLRISAASGP